MQKPDNYLVWAILATLFCCLPFGIVAIVKAASVDNLWAAGKYDEALQASLDACKWSWISAGAGAFFYVVYVLVCVLFFTGLAGVAAGLQ